MTEPPRDAFKQQGDEMCVGLKKRLYSGYSPSIRAGVWVFGPQTSVLYNSGYRYINNTQVCQTSEILLVTL